MNVGMDGVFFGGKTLKRKVHSHRASFGVLFVEDSDVRFREERKPFRPMLELKKTKRKIMKSIRTTTIFFKWSAFHLSV